MTRKPSVAFQQGINGARDTLPLLVAAMPFAIVYGAMAISEGLSSWTALGMSVMVFAGASQFIAVTLLASSTALPIILLTVFVVNLRHMLYATSLMSKVVHLPQRLKIIMAFTLTDETYAVVSNRIHQLQRNPPHPAPGDHQLLHYYYLGSALAMYSNWVFFSAAGVLLGEQVPDMTSWGLDVAMIVAFVGIIVPALKNHSYWACAITAGSCAAFTFDWPNQTGLLFSALVAIIVGITLETLFKTQDSPMKTDSNSFRETQG
ncbi:AzlC family ABC transporter permease [Motiliproteus sp. MSK22-1]|uniref:AzlC family ABC transporter permease n=1 Tax=Motiliproteus sp. MSK22-1 TaxID=1897630 RepID=UPI0009764B78|nr:AzlC family ABC transporter permease [Motiliproteus sp. MSK22-1]OMH39490.1 branched-chain amino acid ABC transporter permease [Motiliproteus sp. MSK22-1]